MQSQPRNSKSENLQLTLQQDKHIRNIAYIYNGRHIAVMTYLQVYIYSAQYNSVIKIIRRVSAPKYILSFPSNSKLLLIHYSDNYCILYDTENYQEIYNIIGMFSDHKGIKISANGYHLLYGNDSAISMWGINRNFIQIITHKLRYIYCYNINHNGTQAYFANQHGQVQTALFINRPQNRNSFLISFCQPIKIHKQVIIGLQIISHTLICTIDYGQQCAVCNINTRQTEIICKIEPVAQIRRPISFVYSQVSKSVYLNIHEKVYKIIISVNSQNTTNNTTNNNNNNIYKIDNHIVKNTNNNENSIMAKNINVHCYQQQIQYADMVAKGSYGRVAVAYFTQENKNSIKVKQL